MKEIVNIPRIHRDSKIGYWGAPLFSLFIYVIYLNFAWSSGWYSSIIILNLIYIPSILFFTFMAHRYMKIRYIIKDGILLSYPNKKIKIKLNEIKDVERIKQLYFPAAFSSMSAATGLSNMRVPGVGWVPSIATNSDDGLMITTNSGEKYVITPSEPEEFMKHLKK